MFPSLFNYLLSCKDTPIIPVSIVLIGYIIVFATSHSYYISAVVYSVSVVLSVTCRCCDSTPTDVYAGQLPRMKSADGAALRSTSPLMPGIEPTLLYCHITQSIESGRGGSVNDEIHSPGLGLTSRRSINRLTP